MDTSQTQSLTNRVGQLNPQQQEFTINSIKLVWFISAGQQLRGMRLFWKKYETN